MKEINHLCRILYFMEGENINMSEASKVSIIVALLALPLGYYLHVLKNRFDKKEIIKSTSRLFKSDINNMMKLVNNYIDSQVYGAISDKFTLFSDWKAEFNNISVSLDDEQSSQLIDIYNTVDKIISIQTERAEYDDEIKRTHPNISGPFYFGDGIVKSLNRQFDDLVKHLANTDYEKLISILEWNSI